MRIFQLTVFCFKIHLCFQELCVSQKGHTIGRHLQRFERAHHLNFFNKAYCVLTWLATVTSSQRSVCEFGASTLPTVFHTHHSQTHTLYSHKTGLGTPI